MGSSRPYPSRSPAHFASIFNDFGGMAVDFLEMPPEMPPQSSGCPGTALDVAGGQNPTFRAIFPGFVAFSGRHRTSPEVYGSGTAGTRTQDQSLKRVLPASDAVPTCLVSYRFIMPLSFSVLGCLMPFFRTFSVRTQLDFARSPFAQATKPGKGTQGWR